MTFPSIVYQLAAVEKKQLASCAGVASGNTAGDRVVRCPVTTVVSRLSGRITGGASILAIFVASFSTGDERESTILINGGVESEAGFPIMPTSIGCSSRSRRV